MALEKQDLAGLPEVCRWLHNYEKLKEGDRGNVLSMIERHHVGPINNGETAAVAA
jgi:hypothetical protein